MRVKSCLSARAIERAACLFRIHPGLFKIEAGLFRIVTLAAVMYDMMTLRIKPPMQSDACHLGCFRFRSATAREGYVRMQEIRMDRAAR